MAASNIACTYTAETSKR